MDSEIHNIRHFIKIHFVNKGSRGTGPGTLKTNLPSYFENIESIQPIRGQEMANMTT